MPEKTGFSRLKLVRTGDMPPPPLSRSPFVELGVTQPSFPPVSPDQEALQMGAKYGLQPQSSSAAGAYAPRNREAQY